MFQTRLDATSEYDKAREELRLAEVDLMRRREHVAELRRGLPEGPIVEDYEFVEGPRDLDAGDEPVRRVWIGELFTAPGRSLVVYHFMYGKAQTSPCPMCTMWLDGLNGIARHLAQNVDFVVVAAADLPSLRRHARARGWSDLRLLSAGSSTFKYDLASEDDDGNQDATVSVFARDIEGQVRHVYTAHPTMADDIDQRGIDLLCATWHVLDLTPEGRDDWYSALSYD